jgi:hypothetical protein
MTKTCRHVIAALLLAVGSVATAAAGWLLSIMMVDAAIIVAREFRFAFIFITIACAGAICACFVNMFLFVCCTEATGAVSGITFVFILPLFLLWGSINSVIALAIAGFDLDACIFCGWRGVLVGIGVLVTAHAIGWSLYCRKQRRQARHKANLSSV